jgi:hypothetical protein
MNIYDAEKSLLIIGPFNYEPVSYAAQALQLEDKILLKVYK